jgi:hypothetical protein
MTVEPPSSCSILVEIEAEWNAGMTSTLAVPDRRQNGYCSITSVERHIGRHLAVILEIDPALVEDPDRVTHALGPFAGRVAEGGIGQHRHARLVAQARAMPAASSAMSASSSELGMSITAVSATNTVRPRHSASDTPIIR